MSELHYRSLSTVRQQLAAGELTSAAVTAHLLERIAKLEPQLASYAMVLGDRAMADAESLDACRLRGESLGALHGVPVAVKDLLFTRGLVTASGSLVMRDFVPDYDATVVTRLREAGAVIIGKTQLTEGAFGAHHPEITAPKNPWSPGHWPGVSSSGTGVAVAAGLAYGGLGSDTGGSIRFPSACCGLVGIKPTYGRVSRYGAFPLAESLDHIGPMTRTVEDAARMLQVLAGRDANDPTSLEDAVPDYLSALADTLPNTRIGVDWEYVSKGVEPAVLQVLREALDVFRGLGAEVKEVAMPAGHDALVSSWGTTCAYECAKAHAGRFPEQREAYGPVLANLLDFGRSVSAEQYAEPQRTRARFRSELDALLTHVDLVIAPCMPTLPPELAEMERAVQDEAGRAGVITFTAAFDYSGHPTLTLPAGLSDTGLPQSFQLIGRFLDEATLIRAGSAYEAAAPFDTRPI